MNSRLLFLLFLLPMSAAEAYESAFPKTEPGILEIKTLPAGTLLKAEGEDSYFESSGKLFQPLFRYIKEQDIAMTVPVEARIEPGAMYFWVDPEQLDRVAGDTATIQVVRLPERTVAAIGVRGAYSESNFNTARAELLSWLESQPGYAPAGQPWAVYWNGPFTLWFLKQFEVQVAVEPVGTAGRD